MEKLSKALDNAMNNKIVNAMSDDEFSQYIYSLAVLSIGTMSAELGRDGIRDVVEKIISEKEVPTVKQIKSSGLKATRNTPKMPSVKSPKIH